MFFPLPSRFNSPDSTIFRSAPSTELLAGIDPVNRFRDVDSSLRARGFQPAGNESSPLIGGRGDIYWNPQKKQIIWVTFDRSGRGSFYCKRSF